MQPSQLDIELVLQAHDVPLHLLLGGSDLAPQLPEAGPTVAPSGRSLAHPTTTPPHQANPTVDGQLMAYTFITPSYCALFIFHIGFKTYFILRRHICRYIFLSRRSNVLIKKRQGNMEPR